MHAWHETKWRCSRQRRYRSAGGALLSVPLQLNRSLESGGQSSHLFSSTALTWAEARISVDTHCGTQEWREDLCQRPHMKAPKVPWTRGMKLTLYAEPTHIHACGTRMLKTTNKHTFRMSPEPSSQIRAEEQHTNPSAPAGCRRGARRQSPRAGCRTQCPCPPSPPGAVRAVKGSPEFKQRVGRALENPKSAADHLPRGQPSGRPAQGLTGSKPLSFTPHTAPLPTR